MLEFKIKLVSLMLFFSSFYTLRLKSSFRLSIFPAPGRSVSAVVRPALCLLSGQALLLLKISWGIWVFLACSTECWEIGISKWHSQWYRSPQAKPGWFLCTYIPSYFPIQSFLCHFNALWPSLARFFCGSLLPALVSLLGFTSFLSYLLIPLFM